jgi:hypothetical protein
MVLPQDFPKGAEKNLIKNFTRLLADLHSKTETEFSRIRNLNASHYTCMFGKSFSDFRE